jgi:GTPase SAR1 family protein
MQEIKNPVQKLNMSSIKEARNILILGHRFSGKTTLTKKLIESYPKTIVMYNHLECGKKEYPDQEVVLYSDETFKTVNDTPKDCVVLDDTLYTKEMTKFNLNLWLDLFTGDNTSIICTQVFDAFSEEQRSYLDLVFIFNKGLNTCDVMGIFNQYIRTFPEFQKGDSFRKFHEIIKSLDTNTPLVLNLNLKKVYMYNTDNNEETEEKNTILGSITDTLRYIKALVI